MSDTADSHAECPGWAPIWMYGYSCMWPAIYYRLRNALANPKTRRG